MKKINSRKNFLSAILCVTFAFALPASVTPTNANPLAGGGYNPVNIGGQVGAEAGMNIRHDNDYLRYQYQEKQREDDYQYYQQRKKLEADPNTGNQIIQNYNGGSMQQAGIEEMGTKGVFVNSVEVAPSEILTKDEINDIVRPLVGRNVFIEDIQKVISLRQMFPVFFGSALKDEGVEEFMEALDLYTCQKEALDILSGIVFKKTFHKQKHLTHLKVTGGTLHVKDVISESKVDELRIYTGQGYQSVQSASTGDIVACLGLDELPIGFTFGNQKQTQQNILKPFMSYQILLPDDIEKSKAIEQILSIGKEDPSLQFEYNQQLGILSVKIMGEIQLDTLQNLILERYGFLIHYDEGRITYLETILDKVEGVGHFEPLRHYAEVHILLEPLERGKGLVFENQCQRNTLPLNFQNLVLTHMQEIQHLGVLT